MADTTAVAIYKLGLQTQDYVREAQAMVGASNQMVSAAERVAVSEEKVGGASLLAANAMQRKIEANDRSIQAARKYAEAIAFAARAEEQQVGTAQQRALYLEQEADKLKRTTDALAAKAKAERDAAQAARDEEAAAKNLARIESEHALALKNTAVALGVDRDALIASANAGNRHAAAMLDMMNKIVGLNKSLQIGKLDLATHAQEVDRVQQAYRSSVTAIATQEAQMRKSATTTGLARYEMINLSRQIQDVGVSLAGGQSPFRILVEQGSQIADIFISSKATVKDFFTGIATSIRGLGSGAAALGIGAFVTTLVVGAGAAAVAWASAQKDVELALLGIGRASGATAQSINEIAKAGATTFGLSISEAREFASILAQTGHIGVDQLAPAVAMGKNLATVLGVSSTEAAKTLGKALAEPGKGIEQLNQSLGQFDAATVRHVQNLMAQNKLLEAQKILMEGVALATKDAGDALSNTSNFWTALGNKISNAAGIVGEFVAKQTGMGQSSQQQLDGLIKQYQEVQRQIEVASPALREFLQLKADSLLSQIGLINTAMEKVGITAEETRRKLLSAADQKMVRDISPEIAQFEQLKNQAEGLRNLLQRIGESGGQRSPILEAMGQTLAQVELSAQRASEALSSALTPAARLTAEFKLGVEAINARTAGERQALVAAQTSLQLAGQNVSASEKRIAVERAVTLEIERQAAAHRDNMAALNDQLAVAKALPGHAQQVAQYEADINARLREGATLMQAEAEAALKRAIAVEQANRAVDQQIISLRQGVEMERARLEGTEASVAAAQAYANAMRSGGSETKAAALAAATLEANLERAQIAAENMANSAARAGKDFLGVSNLAQKLANIGSGSGRSFSAGEFIAGAGPGQYGHVETHWGTGGGPLVGAAGMSTPLTKDIANMFMPSVESMKAAAEKAVQAQEEAARAAADAARAQEQAARDAQEAAKQQAEAAKAAREAKISALDEAVKDIVATKLLAGQSAQAVNMLIEQGAIQFGTASTRFQTQLDLYKRAGASNSQIAADIRSGIIGEGAKPSELLAALDSLTDAVNSNTDAQLGLSPFYTSQGDRQLGYRGYTVQKGLSNIPGTEIGGSTTTIPGGTGTGGTGTGTGGTGTNMPYSPGTGGGIMGGIVNPIGSVAYETGAGQYAFTLDAAGDYILYYNGKPVLDLQGKQQGYDYPAGSRFGGTMSPSSWPAGSVYRTWYGFDGQKYMVFLEGTGAQTGYTYQGSSGWRTFAEGGIVDQPTMAMAGEAGPEAFVPLKGGAIPVKLTGNNDNKPTTVVNINAPLVHFAAEPTRDEVRQSAFQASQMLRRQMAG